MNRGVDRRDVFLDERDRIEFGRGLGDACERFQVSVRAYCLMTNHFHLVLDCESGGLSPFMQHLAGVWTREANERRKSDGPIFRGRFCSRRIDTPEYLLAAIRYVHRNPLAFCSEGDLATYRWSSHRTYLGLRPKPSWMRIDDVLGWAGGAAGFDRIVRTDSASSSTDVLDTTWTARSLLAAIEQISDEMSPLLERSGRGLSRTLARLVADRLPPDAADRLITALGYASKSSADQAGRRARRAAALDSNHDDLVDRVLELLLPCDHLVSDTK